MNDDLRQLRGSYDGADGFMSAHQILKVRKRPKKIPDWALNDVKTRKVIQRVFPRWKTDELQRARASRWAQAIHLYYRLEMPHNHVAEEMGLSYNALKMLLRNIRWSAKGLRTDGRGPITGKKSPGRPKKALTHPRYPS